MKTQEERKNDFLIDFERTVCSGGCYDEYEMGQKSGASFGFTAGAESEHAELTRWNDPKEVLPEVDKMVLVKRKSDAPLPYDLAQYDGSCWVDSWCGLMIEIIGWREIHE